MEFEGAGACQCGAPLAPLLEELSRRRLRGRRGVESAIWEKKERSIENHCHSETSDRCHWSWESVSFPDSSMFLCSAKEDGLPRRFAQRDGGIPRFIDWPPSPFRGNDRLVLDMCVDLYISARCSIAGRHSGRPLREDFVFCADLEKMLRSTVHIVGDGHCAVPCTFSLEISLRGSVTDFRRGTCLSFPPSRCAPSARNCAAMPRANAAEPSRRRQRSCLPYPPPAAGTHNRPRRGL